MGAEESDVLILGGGVIGLACALALLRRGATVRVLERETAGAGASHGNCGTITPSHAEPLFMPGMIRKALRWMWRRDAPFFVSPRPDPQRFMWLFGFARRCNWQDFEQAASARAALLEHSRRQLAALIAAETLDCAFEEAGGLHVYRDPAAFAADAWHRDLLERVGVAMELKTGEEAEAMEPALRPGVAGAEWHPGNAHLRPERFVAELARKVRELGGVIEEQTPVDSFQLAGRRIEAVLAAGRSYRAERYLLALGAWSPLLARQLGLRLPMQPGKGYSITTNRPQHCPRVPVTMHEASVCATVWPDGFRLGSTMELSGYREGLNRVRLDALRRGAREYLHEPWGEELREEWWGWRPMSVDELPLIGPSSRWQNLHLATAHGMLGVSMAPATADLVAAALAGGPPPLDPQPYLPARFGL